MLFLLLALLSVLLAVVQVRRGYAAAGSARSALIQGGTAFLASWLLQAGLLQLTHSRLGQWIPLQGILIFQGVALALLALVLWGALARLVFYRFERRDLLLAIPAFLFSIGIGAATEIVPLLAAFFALPILVRVRWKNELSPATIVMTSLFGFLFILLNFLQFRLPSPEGTRVPLAADLERYADWIRGLASFHILAALPRLLWGLSLPVRSVKRRLLVSHLLAGVVPLALLVIFWGLSTFLSVNGERARMASRYLTEESASMGRVLDQALRETGGVGDRLASWAALEAMEHPGIGVWYRGGQPTTLEGWTRSDLDPQGPRMTYTIRRVYGDPFPEESGLASWPDSLPVGGIVLVGGQAYVGAARSRPGSNEPGPDAVVLIPAAQILGEEFQQKIDARAYLETRYVVQAQEGQYSVNLAPSDRSGSSGGRLRSTGEASAGAALLQAMEWDGVRWHDRRVLLWVQVGFFDAIRGLARNLQENPFNLIPLVFLGVVGVAFILVEVLTLGMVISMGRSILRALSALRQGTARLRSGNLRYRIPIEGDDDLWNVASSFNEMTTDLDKARDIEMERERLEGELDLARQIQARLLPGDVPAVQKTEMAGFSLAAQQVGGDYYDYLPLRSGRIGLIVADVSGKGVPAALLMSSFRAALLSQDLDREGPAATMARLNTFLHRSVEPGRFVTAFLAILDPAEGSLMYANAGHNPPVLINGDADPRLLRDGGLVLGLFPESRYEEVEVKLAAGDLLVLYTDGVTEAANEEEEFWGDDRFLRTLQRLGSQPCRRIMREILSEVRAFSGPVGQSDDITLVCVRWRGDRAVHAPVPEEARQGVG